MVKTRKIVKYSLISALSLVFLSISVMSIWGGCFFEKYNSIQPDRAKLFENIESYQSINEFKKNFDFSSLQWKEESTESLYKIKINKFKHYDFIGELNIIFFNNRLYAVSFYPDTREFKNYIKELSLRYGLKFKTEQKGQYISYTSQDKFTKVYGSLLNNNVVWLDSRLEKEYIKWGKCHD